MSLVLTDKERARMKQVRDALSSGKNPYEDIAMRHVIGGVDKSIRPVIVREDVVVRVKTDNTIISDNGWGKGKHFSGIIPVSLIKGKSSKTVKIGDTLFVDNSPYKSCGWCEIPIKQFGDNAHITIVNGRRTREAQGYKITLGLWKDVEEYSINNDGVLAVTLTRKPVLWQVQGCFDCWFKQDQERQGNKSVEDKGGKTGLVFYNVRERVR